MSNRFFPSSLLMICMIAVLITLGISPLLVDRQELTQGGTVVVAAQSSPTAPILITETISQPLSVKTAGPAEITASKGKQGEHESSAKSAIVSGPAVVYYEVSSYFLNVRTLPDAGSSILRVLQQGERLVVTEVTKGGWLKLAQEGYVNGQYASKLPQADQPLATGKKEADVSVAGYREERMEEREPATAAVFPEIESGSEEAVQEKEAAEKPSDPEQPTKQVKSESGLTAAHIEDIFEGTALAGHGLEQAILDIEQEFGINAFFTIAVMKLESGNGKSRIAKNKNNLFGLNAVDGDQYNKAFSFKTKGDSVQRFGELLAKHYVGKGLETIDQVARKYCPSNSKWPALVMSIMKSDYKKL